MLLKDPYKVRRSGLGILRVISDEAIIELLGYFGGKELANILKLSRALYVFCNKAFPVVGIHEINQIQSMLTIYKVQKLSQWLLYIR